MLDPARRRSLGLLSVAVAVAMTAACTPIDGVSPLSSAVDALRDEPQAPPPTEIVQAAAPSSSHAVTDPVSSTPTTAVVPDTAPAAAATSPSTAATEPGPAPTDSATPAGHTAGTVADVDSSTPAGEVTAQASVQPARAPVGLAGEVVVWQSEQRPSVAGVEQADRIQQVAAPGPTAGRPAGPVMRFELRPGDVQDSSGYLSSRSEVYGRHAQPRSTPAEQWSDPVGSVRWYGFSVFVPADFPTATDTKWVTITQWKGLKGGSPPIALEIKRDQLRLGGARTNAGLVPGDGLLGQLSKGAWTELVVGLSLSPDPAAGWVEVWRDDALVLPRTAVATMDRIDGQVDPVYLKQGLYRSSSWTDTHVIYFGPVTVGSRRSDVS